MEKTYLKVMHFGFALFFVFLLLNLQSAFANDKASQDIEPSPIESPTIEAFRGNVLFFDQIEPEKLYWKRKITEDYPFMLKKGSSFTALLRIFDIPSRRANLVLEDDVYSIDGNKVLPESTILRTVFRLSAINDRLVMDFVVYKIDGLPNWRLSGIFPWENRKNLLIWPPDSYFVISLHKTNFGFDAEWEKAAFEKPPISGTVAIPLEPGLFSGDVYGLEYMDLTSKDCVIEKLNTIRDQGHKVDLTVERTLVFDPMISEQE